MRGIIEVVLAKLELESSVYIYLSAIVFVCELIQLVFVVIELLRALIELVGTLNI